MTVTVYPLTVGTVSNDDTGFVGSFRVPWATGDAAAAEGDVANVFGTGWDENSDAGHSIIPEGEAAGGAFMWANAWGTIAGLPATLPAGTTSVELSLGGGVQWNADGAISSGDYVGYRFALYPPGGPEAIRVLRTPTLNAGSPGLFTTTDGIVAKSAAGDSGGDIVYVVVPLDYGGDWSTFSLNFGAEVNIGFAASPGLSRTYYYSSGFELSLIVTHTDPGPPAEAVWEFSEANWTVCLNVNEAVWEFSEAEWSTCQDVANVVPPSQYPTPPTVQDSGISALPRLDIGYYQVGVYSRGGERRITMLPRVTSLSFKRTLDDTSSASVTCISEEWADLIHPWQHEIHIFRNNRLVWCGPVRDKEYDPETGTIVIDCRDLFAWMDFRTARNEIDLLETDVADVFVALMEGALVSDPSPNIKIDKTAVGSTIDFYYDPETPKIVAEDLRQMAEAGVDYTTYLRTVIVRGEYLDKPPIGTLLRSHLAKMPLVKESGEMATQLFLAGAGGELHLHPDSRLTPAQWDLHPYGLLEQVYDADKLFDSDDVSAIEKAGKSRYELMKEPRLFLSDLQLAPSAPVEMEDLIPGSRIDVKMEVGAIPLISMYRLQTLSVDVDGTSETISLEVTSLGDYDKDTPL